MSFTLHGLGTALPEFCISMADAAAEASAVEAFSDSESMRLQKLYKLTTVEQRYSVLLEAPEGVAERQSFFQKNGHATVSPGTAARMERYAAKALPLAQQAAVEALERAGLGPAEITHLITVSCSGFCAPGVDAGLIETLPLSPTTERTHVGFMGCHGALNGLRVAKAIGESQADARILLVAVELCSLHYQYGWDLERQLANALFADGAAAAVGWSGGEDDDWRVAATGSCMLPDSADAMTWRIGDHGFHMTLSKEVPRLIQQHLAPWVTQWLAKSGLGIGDIATWAVHPGGPAILKAAQKALALPQDALAVSHEVLQQHGNMSSPTILFILDRLCAQDAPRPCVALGFGPGLVAEAALFR